MVIHVADIWDMLSGRLSGPLSARLIIQPLVAGVLGVREGLKDARAGQSPYGWLLISHPHRRSALILEGWRHIRKLFLVAVIVDMIYELIVFRWIHPLQVLIVAATVAIPSYVLIRGLTNRVARRWLRNAHRPPNVD